jgi:hypothetical protein
MTPRLIASMSDQRIQWKLDPVAAGAAPRAARNPLPRGHVQSWKPFGDGAKDREFCRTRSGDNDGIEALLQQLQLTQSRLGWLGGIGENSDAAFLQVMFFRVLRHRLADPVPITRRLEMRCSASGLTLAPLAEYGEVGASACGG